MVPETVRKTDEQGVYEIVERAQGKHWENQRALRVRPSRFIHRENGPAFMARYPDGTRLEMYYWDGQDHREDGPAFIVTGPNGKFIAQNWYNHGELIKEEEGDWVPPTGMQKVKEKLGRIIHPFHRPPRPPSPGI